MSSSIKKNNGVIGKVISYKDMQIYISQNTDFKSDSIDVLVAKKHNYIEYNSYDVFIFKYDKKYYFLDSDKVLYVDVKDNKNIKDMV